MDNEKTFRLPRWLFHSHADEDVRAPGFFHSHADEDVGAPGLSFACRRDVGAPGIARFITHCAGFVTGGLFKSSVC